MSKMLRRSLSFFLFSLVSFSGFFSVVEANDLDFEFIRSEDSPGFFALQIYPSEWLDPIPIRNVFVRNYSENFSDEFLVLENDLRAKGFDVIDLDERNNFLIGSFRFVYLGERDAITDKAFMPVDFSDILKSFEVFSQRELGPVYLRNVRVEMGGNVQQIFPEVISYIGNDPEIFVGKFTEERLTRMRIFAETFEGDRFVEVPLDFSVRVDHPLRENLGEIWEEYFSFSERKVAVIYDERWVKYFPYVLGILGVLLILLALWPLLRKKSPKPPLTRGLNEDGFDDGPHPASPRGRGDAEAFSGFSDEDFSSGNFVAKEGKKKVLEIPPPPKYWDHYPTQRSFEAGEDREFWEGNSK